VRRRDFVLLSIGAAACGLSARGANSPAAGASPGLSSSDREFLEDLEHRAFLYFWEQADPNTGLVLDRASAEGGRAKGPSRDIANAAASGFGLTALAIGAERGWITKAQAADRIRTTLQFLAERAPHEHGWFYHWMNYTNGERRWDSESSSVDTAFLLAGALTAGQRFADDADIPHLAKVIYNRVDFRWMLDGSPLLLSHGFVPGKGFLNYRWDTYSEGSLLYLLAIASETHPIDPQSWYAWQRPYYQYGPYSFISGGPLFTHQYSHAWVDFRGRRDEGFIDFFQNSIAATRANRLFCLNLKSNFPASFGPEMWGVTASDSRRGYKVYSEIAHFEPVDGTIAPCGPAGSLMFTPDISIPAIRDMKERFGDQVYRRYGFVDAFNPGAKWFDTDVIGIDVGITLLSAENLLTGNIWRWFMSDPAVPRAMDLVGFSPPPSQSAAAPVKPSSKRPARSRRRRRA
jgi:hypothetical protein